MINTVKYIVVRSMHSLEQGWANFFNGSVMCSKTKTPASRKISL